MTTENRERSASAYLEQISEESFLQLVQAARTHAEKRLTEGVSPQIVSVAVHEHLLKAGYPSFFIKRDQNAPYTVCIKDKTNKDICVFSIASTDARNEQLKEKRNKLFDASPPGSIKEPARSYAEIRLIIEGLEFRNWSYESMREIIFNFMLTYCPQVKLDTTSDLDIEAVYNGKRTRLYSNFVKEVPVSKKASVPKKSIPNEFKARAVTQS